MKRLVFVIALIVAALFDHVAHADADAPDECFSSSEAVHERRIAGRRRGQYAGASPTRQLHCQGPDTAGTAVDQDALSGGKVRMFEERLPSCQRRKRQRCGLCVRDAARLQSQIDRAHCRELSSCAVTRKISKSIDLVADPKISYISRHALHHPETSCPGIPGILGAPSAF